MAALKSPPITLLAVVPVLFLLLPVAGAGGEMESTVVALELSRTYDREILERAASAGDAATRRAAARAAGRIRDERALDFLLPLLTDGVGPVRRAALFALGQIGTSGVVIPLRSALGNAKSPADLPYVLEALGKTRDPRAVTEVAARLAHTDRTTRGAAALALFRLGSEAALPELFSALTREREDEPRWRMVYTCARLLSKRSRRTGSPVAAPAHACDALRASALDPRRPFLERVFAAGALGAVDGQRGALLELLEDEDPRVVVAAIRGLARPWEEAVARRIAEFLEHEDPLLREVALDHVLAGGDSAAPLLGDAAARLAGDERLHLRVCVARAASGAADAREELVDPSPAEEELLWRVNSHLAAEGCLPDTLPRSIRGKQAAAEVCGEKRVPEERAVEVLLALLDDGDPTVKTLAIGSLAKRGLAGHADRIAAAARAAPGISGLDVRQEAAAALGKLGTFHPWLREAAGGDPAHPVREAARAALAELKRTAPPAVPRSGFTLHGLDAAGILKAARELRGARVVLETTRGSLEMVLLPDEAPVHCVNLATLVRRGFYDGLTWHRVVADFVVQGGCPRGDGWGGPGYLLPDEIGTRPYVRGTVGMPKAGDDTGGCQIFITHLPTPHLDGKYTVFAQVVSGLAVVDALRVGDRIERARLAGEGR